MPEKKVSRITSDHVPGENALVVNISVGEDKVSWFVGAAPKMQRAIEQMKRENKLDGFTTLRVEVLDAIGTMLDTLYFDVVGGDS